MVNAYTELILILSTTPLSTVILRKSLMKKLFTGLMSLTDHTLIRVQKNNSSVVSTALDQLSKKHSTTPFYLCVTTFIRET